MKTLILFITASLLILVSCSKEDLNENINTQNNTHEKGEKALITSKYMPGEVFYEDGWIGWINPNLWEGDLPPEDTYKETAKWKGTTKVDDEGDTYIDCPDDGECCGRLYTVTLSGGVRYTGLYLNCE